MPHWMIKAVTQKAISLLPGSRAWNHLFQTYVTRSLDLDVREPSGLTRFAAKVTQCCTHVSNYTSTARPAGYTVLELGTGWNPVVPVGLFLCGAREVWTIDQTPLLTVRRVRDVIAHYLALAGRPDFPDIMPQADSRRVADLERALAADSPTPAALLGQLNIRALVGDACWTGLPAAAMDLIVSNNTIEHIPAPDLPTIFQEFRRVSSPSTIMSHFIDMADHYVNFDHNLSPYNFLRFSNAAWRRLDNPLQHLNRLRINDYRALHQAAGFTIRNEHDEANEASRLARFPLAPEFQRYLIEDIAVTSSWLVSVPTPGALPAF
jgi:hypothetical protein